MHIPMAGQAIGALRVKVRRLPFVQVTRTACDGGVLSGQWILCHGMRRNAECRRLESIDGVAGFASIRIWRCCELALMHIVVARLAVVALWMKIRRLAFVLMTLDARNQLVFPR